MNLMSPVQVKSLLLLASQLSGYTIPDNVPQPAVEMMYSQEMIKAACVEVLGVAIPCGVVGFFEPDTGELAIDAESGADPESSQSINTITVHELTHWLQYHSDHWPKSCPDRFNIEYEAYRTSLAFQITYEGREIPDYFRVPTTICPLGQK